MATLSQRKLSQTVEKQVEKFRIGDVGLRCPCGRIAKGLNCASWRSSVGPIFIRALASFLFLLTAFPVSAIAQDAQPDLAFVGNMPITSADVDLLLGRERDGSARLKGAALANAVEMVAKQRQALQTLRAIDLATSRNEVDLWLVQNAPASQADSEAEQVLSFLAEKSQVSRESYLDYVSFRLSWQRYLAKHLNAANVVKHFNSQRQRFDGTTYDVDIVSIAVPPGAGKKRTQANEKLTEFVRTVQAKQQASESQAAEEFEALATEYKLELISKSRVRGIGDIEHAVVDQILQLKAGEVSGPFSTAGGVHVIKLREVYVGGRELEKVRGEVRLHMLVFLLDRLAQRGAKQLPFVASN